ncbi:MAG: phosphoglycerate dehydrogenase [Rhodospirillales bacterium]
MTRPEKIAVTSRSFSRHPVLRVELERRYKNITFNEQGTSLRGNALIEFLRGHDTAITALEPLGYADFKELPELKIVSKYGVGFDSLDIDAMTTLGIKLGWTGGVNCRSVAELVIAYAVSLLRELPAKAREVREGYWQQSSGRLLSERTVGIIGCGHVGKDLAVLLRAFGCRVLTHDLLDFPEFYQTHAIEPVALNDLLRQSDIVTLHLPLDDSTRNILNAEKLSLLRKDSILINAARGGLVDEAALKEKLKTGEIAGAAFDVFADEPPGDAELLNLPNFIATPHIGGSTEEAILAMGRAAIDGLENARVPDSDWPPRS